MVATPYQVKHPSAAARRLAPVLHISEADILQALDSGSSGFAYLAREVDLATAERVRKLEHHRGRHGAGDPADLPGGEAGRPGDRDRRGRRPGADRARGSRQRPARRRQRRARGDRRRARQGDRAQHDLTGAQHGQDLKLTIDAEIQARDRAGARRASGQTYQPKGATAIVMNPRNSQILAMANWPTVDPNDPARRHPQDLAEHGHRLHLRAGLDLQGVHGRRGARAASGHPEHRASTCRPSSRSPTGRSPTPSPAARDASRSPRSSPSPRTSARSRSASKLGAAALLRLGAAVRVRRADRGRSSRARSRGSCRPRLEFSGSTMGNLPIGQGLSVTPMQMAAAYSAIADGGSPAPAAAGPGPGRHPGRRAAGPPGDQRRHGRPAAPDARGRAGPRRHRVGGQRARLHARGQDGNRAGGGRTAATRTRKFIASFVGFAPAQDPRLLVAVVVNQPQGGNYYGGTVAAPAFGEIAKFALCPTWRSRRDQAGRRPPVATLESPR